MWFEACFGGPDETAVRTVLGPSFEGFTPRDVVLIVRNLDEAPKYQNNDNFSKKNANNDNFSVRESVNILIYGKHQLF